MPSRNCTDLIARQRAMDLAEATYRAPAMLPNDEKSWFGAGT